jgi:hypothetical protein
LWDDDVTVATGTASGGISIDYDEDGNLYAVRCTTYQGRENARLAIYKSSDGGILWSFFNDVSFGYPHEFSYPVVLAKSGMLYLLFLTSANDGDIYIARFNLTTGSDEGIHSVKVDADIITYFAACIGGSVSPLIVLAYQKEGGRHATPSLYTIRSNTGGETWSEQSLITTDGAHPDIAYDGLWWYYLTYESTGGGDSEIWCCKNTNFGSSGSWQDFEALTEDTCEDSYPKVATLFQDGVETPEEARVFVVYSHNFQNSYSYDLRSAGSTNAGIDWYRKDWLVAHSGEYSEMACDLWVDRSDDFWVGMCFLRYRFVPGVPPVEYSDIYFARCNETSPSAWSIVGKVSNHTAAFDLDSRKVCQITNKEYDRSILYVGKPRTFGYENLYYDRMAWTDVEEDETESGHGRQFSLLPNFPNPFNPDTRIRYSVHGTSDHPAEITLAVYNVLGQKVRTLVSGPREPGTHEVIWDGRDDGGQSLASGIYFCRLEAEDFTETKKMLLIR